MALFTEIDLSDIDRLWRSVPPDHVWTGWSATGATPQEVILYRTRAHWRRFPLRKSDEGFVIYNENENAVAKAKTLSALLTIVESIPGLENGEDGT